MAIDWSKYGISDDKNKSPGIDWTKYGITDEQQTSSKSDNGIDWEKYLTPQTEYQQEQSAVKSKYGALPSIDVNRSPVMQKIQQTPVSSENTSQSDGVSKWNSILDNPITDAAETGLKWLQKPFETVSVTLADAGGALNNLLGGTRTVKGFDGNDITLTRSEKRNLAKDIKDIWTQTNENVSSQAWHGTEPNLGRMPGTSVDWADVIDFGAQSISPTKLPLSLAAGAKVVGQLAQESKLNSIVKNAEFPVDASRRLVQRAGAGNITGNADLAASNFNRQDTLSKIQDVRKVPSDVAYSKSFKPDDPVNLDDLVKSKGFQIVEPETIAQTYNGKTWYHGTGTDKLTTDSLDPFVGNHESLFGQGVYLTDSPDIAKGYAKSRGARTKTPTIYQANVNVSRVLDLEKPVTADVVQALDKTVKPLDSQYQHHIGEPNYFTNMLNTWVKEGQTPEQIITNLRREVSDFSHEAEIPTSEFVENFQELAVNLKEAGYDAITHTGGLRTGKDPHRVLIMLDPKGHKWSRDPHPNQITRFDKYDGSSPVASKEMPMTDFAQDRIRFVTPEQPKKSFETPSVSNRIGEQTAEPLKESWFQRLFGNQTMGISAFGNKEVRSGTGMQIVNTPIKNTVGGLLERTKAAGRSVYQNHVDMNDPLKKISKETYDTAMDAQRANQVANTLVRDKFVDPQGNVVGKGLRELIRQHGTGAYNDLVDYLVARHAPTRMRRGEQVYDPKLEMTPEKVEARVKELESRHPEFKQIGQDWNDYYKNIRDVYGVKEGLITPELSRYLEKENPNYTPMFRQFTDKEKFAKPTRMGTKPAFSGQKAPIKEVSPTGSARKIVDPVRSTIEATGAWVNAAFRNRVMQKVIDAVTSDPAAMKKIAEIVQPPKGQADLVDILKNDGEEAFLQAMQEDFDGLFKRTRLDQDNIVRAMVNGKPVYVKVHDPEAVKALLGMGPEQSNLVLHVFKTLSNSTKYGATGALAPMFAVKGALMDLPQAIIQSRNPLIHMMDFGHALISSIANELKVPGLRNLAQDFERTGGGYSAALRGERQLRKGVSDMKNRPLLSAPNLAIAAGKTIAAPFKVLNSISDMTENIHRIAAYRSEMRRLGDVRTPENVRKAMEASREITTNYSRRGRQSKSIEAFIPYQNAAIQGLYRIARQWNKNPVKTAALVTTTIMLPKFIEYSQFHDDTDYNNLPARERYRNLIISKNADGTFNKIPMTPEYNALGALFVDLLRSYKDGNPEVFKGASDAVVNAYTPPVVSGAAQGITQGGGLEQSLVGVTNSTVLGPATNVIANRSFTGAPIVSRAVGERSPRYQYDEKTSAVAKRIGDVLNFSPMKVDYILRAYGGDPARLVLPLTSPVGGGTERNTLLKNFIVDPTFTNNLTTDYYDAKEKLTQAYNDHQDMDIPFPKWYDDGLRNQLTSTANGSVSKRLSTLTDQKKALSTDKSLTAEQRAQRIRIVQQQINEIYIDINSKLREKGVPMANR